MLFLCFAHIIRVQFTLDDLERSKYWKGKLEKVCDELDDEPAQCMFGSMDRYGRQAAHFLFRPQDCHSPGETTCMSNTRSCGNTS